MRKDGVPVRVLPTEAYFAMVRQKLSDSGQAYVRVTGMSMRPLLRHLQDGVILVPPDRIRWGDIVLFDRRNGRYALHRVIRVKKRVFTMAGDNQWYFESDLPRAQIIGVAKAVVRGEKVVPRGNFFLKVYTVLVTGLAFPRIYLRKAIVRMGKLVCRLKNGDRKEAKG